MGLLGKVISFDDFLEAKALSHDLKLERGKLFEGIESWGLFRGDDAVIEMISENDEQFLFFSPTNEGVNIASSIVCFLNDKGIKIKKIGCGEISLGTPRPLVKKIVALTESIKSETEPLL